MCVFVRKSDLRPLNVSY
uniref:Uncharacterized protein n=1 Tax=Glossina morsitans morsitans TaxID=37546 RepID=A0ABK9NGF9_GLOMM